MANYEFLAIEVSNMGIFIGGRSSFDSKSSPRLVPIAIVAIYAGFIVQLFCVLAIAIWLLTGFIAIDPRIAVILLILGFGFLAMGFRMQRQNQIDSGH